MSTAVYNHQYYQAHKAEHRAYNQAYWRANMEKLKAQSKAQRQRDADKNRERTRRYMADHPEKLREYRRRWAQKNKLRHRAYGALRRSKEVCSEFQKPLIEKLYLVAKTKKGLRCYYCQQVIKGTPHIDHVTAIAKGGNHAVENLAISCSTCNQSKNARALSEWHKHPQRLLPL
jgi:5-methylcytosine-specific restriction endonuclease McrA